MFRILLVEDEEELVQALKMLLEREGFAVDDAPGQTDAVRKMEENGYDLALVDVMLSDGNGFAVCAAAKRHGIAVIFLTASADEYSTVAGLEMGAEDYLGKPFRPRELLSRIRKVLQQGRPSGDTVDIRGLRVDMRTAKVFRDGEEIFLSALEYRLLLVFLQHKGETLGRDRLLAELWDAAGEYVNDNTLSVYIKRLREKIEPVPAEPVYIVTVRGLGYRLDP